MPLRPATIDELRWYFEQCRALPADATHAAEPRFYRDRSAFQSARFQFLYRAWRHDGDAILVQAGSPVLAHAVAAAAGRIEVRIFEAPGRPSRITGRRGLKPIPDPKRGSPALSNYRAVDMPSAPCRATGEPKPQPQQSASK